MLQASLSSLRLEVKLLRSLLMQTHMTQQDGVVLGADTRSTSDTTVADKNCEKIHFIAPNIYCCGAGTAADTENVTGKLCAFLLELPGPPEQSAASQQRCFCQACISCQPFFVPQAWCPPRWSCTGMRPTVSRAW